LIAAVSTAVRSINTAKDMRFKENPKWWDIGGQFTNFVRDNKDLLQKLSGALKIVSLVAGLLSFIPVLAPIMGPIALGTALLASAIDLSIYAATGEGDLTTILVDVGLNLLPGVGKLARMGAGALRGTRVASAFSSVAQRGRNMMQVAKWGLANPRLHGIEAIKRLVRLDPIDIATGAVVLTQTDVDLPGLLPMTLSRTHISSYGLGSWFGRSWASTFDQRLEADDRGVYVTTADGMTLIYPPAESGGASVLPVEGPRWPLTSYGRRYAVNDAGSGRSYHYTPPGPHDPTRQWHLTAITGRNGHRIDIHRMDDGTPTDVVHSGGYQVRVHVDANRVVGLGLVDGEGETPLLRFGYNSFGDLTEVLNSSGLPQRFDYDPEGCITRWIDRNGTEYRYSYDRAGRCVTTDGTGGYLIGRIEYDDDTRTTTVIDSYGHASVYRISKLIQVESETDRLGNITRYSWDRYDRLTSHTDPLGRTTSYVHDEHGNLVETVRPDGSRSTARYNDDSLPVEVIDFDGARWCREYDARGNLVRTEDPTGAVVRYVYDEAGHLAEMVDPVGGVTRVATNPAGLPVRVSDPLGATTEYTRDQAGRVVAVADAMGSTAWFGSTADGRLAWRRTADGANEEWVYDGEGNVIDHTNQVGATTSYEIGPFDLVVARTEPDGGRFAFTYDTELRLTGVSDPHGRVWGYEYDPVGRLVRETDFNGAEVCYDYDAAGQFIRRTNALGQSVEFDRDPLGNVVQRRTPDGVTAFEYDPLGRLLRASGPDADLVLERDLVGRVLVEAIDGQRVESAYDAAGRRTGRRTPSGFQTRWEYDAAHRPVVVDSGGEEIRFGYDATGHEVRRDIGGLTLSRTWAPGDQLVAQALDMTAGGGIAQPVSWRTYSYRADGYPEALTDHQTGRSTLSLDAAGRVLAVDADRGGERYAYDLAGNVTHADWPGAGELRGDREYDGTLIRRAGTMSYRHDLAGRLIQRRQGTLIWLYNWDTEDRLTELVEPDGTRWHYRYDPLGRRIGKRRHNPDGSVVEQVTFAWDDRLLEETRSGGKVGRTRTWEYAPGTFTPIGQTDARPNVDALGVGSVDRRFFAIIADLVGAPTELVDAAGHVVWTHRANVWGQTVHEIEDSIDCPLRFPGQYHDPESGSHYNYRRYYDPALARYHSPDPLGLTPAPNPHGYVPNPTVEIDPLGLAPYNLDDVAARHGGVPVSQGFAFPTRRSARQAASEMVGDLGSQAQPIRASDFRGGPYWMKDSTQVIGRQNVSGTAGWRDDFLGHTFPDGASMGPHVNVWGPGIDSGVHLFY
jgi:RHS repeat-associated protein